VLFIHGNFSSATWWEETMVKLPPQYRAIAPDQRGFGGADPAVKVNAFRKSRFHPRVWGRLNSQL